MTVSPPPAYVIHLATWDTDGESLRAVRRAVFIEEQSVEESDEWDDLDPGVTHVLAWSQTDPTKRELVGTGRLEPTGKIGRVAVMQRFRGTGAGLAIMRRLVQLAAERGFAEVYLNAQEYACGFYERLGFRAEGPVFDEVGIPHRRMRLRIGKSDASTAGADGDAKYPVEP
jgi:predicted GNAT family N-acyltransferase